MGKVDDQQRKQRVEQARRCAERLEMVESQLLDALTRLPALTREVGAIRSDLLLAVGPINKSEESK